MVQRSPVALRKAESVTYYYKVIEAIEGWLEDVQEEGEQTAAWGLGPDEETPREAESCMLVAHQTDQSEGVEKRSPNLTLCAS